ncbi:putative oxygenase MesX [Histophilus somni]|uniref:putative oxygenase MesX n=1 Tax=Histophilus somni TaxID=731 RepID=UPI00094AA4CA|nr:putative oxygenase MesX [Histophilus somni]
MMTTFECRVHTLEFDENYQPEMQSTRLTTNFANLARGENRKENLQNVIAMIDKRFNDLANWDNPTNDRYSVKLEIVSIDIDMEGKGKFFPALEWLKTYVIDHKTGKKIDGIVGNNFSSFVRDYDFSVLLLEHNRNKEEFTVPKGYGELHGKLFKHLLTSSAYKEKYSKPPVICLSVATTRTYRRTTNVHPILGVEYHQDNYSLTDEYFAKMGLSVRYFMPPKSVAPYAFYFDSNSDLLNDYTNLELISTIATMEAFQKIYRPEIYNANSVAGQVYKGSLTYQDYSVTKVEYDRVERTQLAIKQGKYTEAHFIKPYKAILDAWMAEK